jgi:DNA-binding transcriptional MerR regulator
MTRSASAGYPIRAVARLTGVSVDTLRAWERRYQAVVPDRGDRGRVYTERHIDRLKQLTTLVSSGHAIGSIAGLSDGALRRLRGDTVDAPRRAPAAANLDPLLRAVRHYDLDTIESQFHRFALLLPPAELIFGVVLPVLRDIGQRWGEGAMTPAQEHLVSGIIRGVLGGLLRVMPRPAHAARIVFAAPANERHELGLLCGAVLAAAGGYSVIYLGPDLPAVEIAKAVTKAEAKTLVLAGTASDVDYTEFRTLARLANRIAVWVGGARAADLRQAIGARARLVGSLEELRGLLDRHAA